MFLAVSALSALGCGGTVLNDPADVASDEVSFVQPVDLPPVQLVVPRSDPQVTCVDDEPMQACPVATAPSAPACASPRWAPCDVPFDDNIPQGSVIGFALGPDGSRHVTYYAFPMKIPAPGEIVLYASDASGVWRREQVAEDGNRYFPPPVVLDQDLKPHVHYAGGEWPYAMTAHLVTPSGGGTGGPIANEVIPKVAYASPFFVDAAGGLRAFAAEIIEAEPYSLTLRVSVSRAGVWTLEPINSPVTLGWYTGLKAAGRDASGTLHLVYCNPFDGLVHHLAGQDATWSDEAFTNNDRCVEVEADVSPSGVVHALWRSSLGYLRYLTNGGGTWTNVSLENVAFSGYEGFSITAGADGQPHIAFPEYRAALWAGTSGSITRLVYVTREGATWRGEVVDDHCWVGAHPVIRVDVAGVPHVAYYDGTQVRVRYAARNACSATPGP